MRLFRSWNISSAAFTTREFDSYDRCERIISTNSCTTSTFDCSTKALLQGTESLGAARRADDGVSRRGGCKHQVVAYAVQPAGVRKQRQLNISHLGCLSLTGLRDRHRAVRTDGDRERVGRKSDRRLQRISVRGHNVALRIQMESPGARVGKFAIRHSHLKKSLALNREIQRVARSG